jgi:hypothetical protein
MGCLLSFVNFSEFAIALESPLLRLVKSALIDYPVIT